MTRPGLARKITEAAALASAGDRNPWITPGPSRGDVLRMVS
jgi:hypothetical protein